MSNTTTANWHTASQPSMLSLLKEAFAATPLGLMLAAVKTGR
jgi:hypothetical protein